MDTLNILYRKVRQHSPYMVFSQLFSDSVGLTYSHHILRYLGILKFELNIFYTKMR